MRSKLSTMHGGVSVLLGLSLLFGGTPTISATTKFVRTGDCEVGIYTHALSYVHRALHHRERNLL